MQEWKIFLLLWHPSGIYLANARNTQCFQLNEFREWEEILQIFPAIGEQKKQKSNPQQPTTRGKYQRG